MITARQVNTARCLAGLLAVIGQLDSMRNGPPFNQPDAARELDKAIEAAEEVFAVIYPGGEHKREELVNDLAAALAKEEISLPPELANRVALLGVPF